MEYEVVESFKAHGFEAQRAWGSNGKALGLDEAVDCVVRNVATLNGIRDITIQAKRRKSLADYLYHEEVDITVVRKDGRGHKRLYVIPEDVLFQLIAKQGRTVSDTPL